MPEETKNEQSERSDLESQPKKSELTEQDIEQVVGGTGGLMGACAGGAIPPKVIITV